MKEREKFQGLVKRHLEKERNGGKESKVIR